jgi:hypothetical protein
MRTGHMGLRHEARPKHQEIAQAAQLITAGNCAVAQHTLLVQLHIDSISFSSFPLSPLLTALSASLSAKLKTSLATTMPLHSTTQVDHRPYVKST